MKKKMKIRIYCQEVHQAIRQTIPEEIDDMFPKKIGDPRCCKRQQLHT